MRIDLTTTLKVPLATLGVIVTLLGLASFGWLLHWHLQFEQRRAAALGGKVPAVTLVVREVRKGDPADEHWHGVVFDDRRFNDSPFRESNPVWCPNPGEQIPAFRFGPDD